MAEVKPPSPRKPPVDPLEARRLDQPCLRTIDLRPERGKRCRAYPHGGRTHWLDDSAIAAFEQALTDYQGRYTIGVYERTLASDSQVPASGGALPPGQREPVVIEQAIRRIPFGYRPHRHESRMNFVSALAVEPEDGPLAGQRLAGKTVDLSLLGVRVQIAAEHKLATGTIVLLHYDELQQRAGEPLGAIAYTVLGSDRDGDRQLLRLKRRLRAGEQAFDAFVPGFIEQQLARYKMELKDALPATYARLYERLYSQCAGYALAGYGLAASGAELLFVGTGHEWQRSTDLRQLPALAARLGQSESSRHWPGQTALTSQSPLQFWLRADRGDYLIPAPALGPARRADWQRLAEHAVAIAAVGQRQAALDLAPLQPVLELLPDELASVSLSWQERLQRLAYALAIVPLGPLPEPLPASTALPDWLREYALVPDRLAGPPATAPLTAFGLRGARKQDRFRYQTPVLLHREDGSELPGESIDFSINGLGIELHSDAALSSRELLRVSFPVLQQRLKEPDELADQPYRVVRQQGRLLTLERDFRVVGHRAARFFAHIIQQNRGRLPVCQSEQQETVEALLTEQALVHCLPCSPLFLARDADKHPQLLALGLRNGQPPAAPFAGPEGDATLNALADLPVLYDLLAEVCNAVGAVDRLVWRRLLLQPGPPPRWQVLAAEAEPASLRTLLQQGFKLYQLVLSPVPGLPRRELDEALLPILGNSRHRANAFRTELARLVGIASLFDISAPAQAALASGLHF